MEFIWSDGGRAACGYVGLTGDCVTRSIAIATGLAYRDVYQGLSKASDKTARHGITSDVYADLSSQPRLEEYLPLTVLRRRHLPRGVVIVAFQADGRNRTAHLACVIDHTVYDTWNPMEDPAYRIVGYWINESVSSDTTSPIVAPSRRPAMEPGDLTQNEFSKILHRVTALHRTASNDASTEGEIRNAMRMMQNLMLKHNLSRSDIVQDDDASQVRMTRRACPLNGRRCYQWEIDARPLHDG